MLTVLTAAPTKDLTILASVKLDLNITSTTDDDYLESLIDDASDIIADACNRPYFGRESLLQTERLTNSIPSIFLERDINPAITEVKVGGTVLAGTDYELDGFELFRLSSDTRCDWVGGSKVEIKYDAGFVLLGTLPRSIERACRDMVVSTYRSRGRDRTISRQQTEGVGSVAFFDMANWQSGFPPAIQGVVNTWRRANI